MMKPMLCTHNMLHTPTVHLNNISNIFITEVERFDEEYVEVMLKRVPDGRLSLLDYSIYSASATPDLDVWFIETKTSKLRVTYNTNYNLSVVVVLCDHVVATAHLDLHFGERDTTTITDDYCTISVIIIVS